MVQRLCWTMVEFFTRIIYIITAKVKHVAEIVTSEIWTFISWFDISHFHYHILPINNPRDLDIKNAKKRENKDMEETQLKIISYL